MGSETSSWKNIEWKLREPGNPTTSEQLLSAPDEITRLANAIAEVLAAILLLEARLAKIEAALVRKGSA